MAEEKNESRPARKLTVKNFSVIEEAELEFGKITVLIGPQASGKSLLCKLAYFFGFNVIEFAAVSAGRRRSWESFFEAVQNNFGVRFPKYAWGKGQFWIRFESEAYEVEVSRDFEDMDSFQMRFSTSFRELYAESSAWDGADDTDHPVENEMRIRFRLYNSLHRVASILGEPRIEISRYIPAGRSFFANLNSAFALMQNENLDSVLREFALYLDWDTAIVEKPTNSSIAAAIRKRAEQIQGGRLEAKGSELEFVTPDGRGVPLRILSSGTQELVPLLMVVSRLVQGAVVGSSEEGLERTRDYFLIVEEPEAHLFPNTQYELVQLFSWLTSDPTLRFSWVITTHSPYILSSFNNLIEAGQAGSDTKLREEVARIIPEQYWIKSGDFAAYAIEDGRLKSILNDSGFVEGNYLDQVSETISDEFDRLIKLEYDHAKAS